MGKPYKSTHAVQITDTTDADAIIKIRSAYARAHGDYGVRDALVDVIGRRNSLDIGAFAVGVLHNPARAHRLTLALNYAPPDKKEGTVDNARNDFYFADLGDAVCTGGTTNGMELSYIKERIQSLFRLTTTNALKSQFRSLEILPRVVTAFSLPKERNRMIQAGDLVEVRDIDALVPTVPDITHVIEVDNFKNAKLYLSARDEALLRDAKEVQFSFGKKSIELEPEQTSFTGMFNALVSPTLFAAPLGTNLLSQTSSSLIRGGKAVPMIATIRAQPAATDPEYDVPKVGQPVRLVFRP